MKYLQTYNYITENPDSFYKNGSRTKWDNGGIAFGYYNNEMIYSVETHADATLRTNGRICGRTCMTYPGRIWVEKQVISFWQFPDPDRLEKIIEKLSDDLEITIDDDFDIEIRLLDGVIDNIKNLDWTNDDEHEIIFVKPSDYKKYWS